MIYTIKAVKRVIRLKKKGAEVKVVNAPYISILLTSRKTLLTLTAIHILIPQMTRLLQTLTVNGEYESFFVGTQTVRITHTRV